MERALAFIGFGEAGAAFARPHARAYDRKLGCAVFRETKRAEMDRAEVTACDRADTALAGAQVVLSVVTADQALAAARDYAAYLAPGALWLDLNSVAPDTKRAATAAVEAAGAQYVDVAVMAPVNPARLAVPLLVAGPHAERAAQALHAIGFSNVACVSGPIGAASAIKMIRSVMVKGIEALSAECAIAAQSAGVVDEVIASLDASWPNADWARRFDYNLDRMMVHGSRRAAEMREAADTLASLGVEPVMTRGTVALQARIGHMGMTSPPGLAAKLASLAGASSPHGEALAA